ncbi:MAG TPA: protein kinase [Bryobacteraceae bacterium]|nr:protein kinase [Bryobacteraceae bacterium]
MTSEEFQQLRRTFERLVAATEEERAGLIEELSESDAVLASELERMLAAYASRTSLLDQTATAPMAPELVNFNPSVSARAGLKIGSYVVESELGRGGMGVVYQARRADGSFQRQVAIKILRHDRIDVLFLRRFHQERQILAQLNHPHIASILDGGETPDGDPYFVMEYVDGVPITTYCEAHGLNVDQKLGLFLQICDAVQHAHRNLTVHRDLKPSNILVTGAGAVKLLDFGIAKLLQGEPGAAPEPTAAILTPEYASPEQIRREPITTAADVFSLGILLYEMLSGRHPFRRKGALPHEVMRAICEDDPAPMSEAAERNAKQLRGELDTIVLTALRKQPSWRYPSVEQLADDIDRYRRGWPVLAKGDSVVYRFRKFSRRQWPALASAALVMLLLAGGIVATTHQTHLAEQAQAAAEHARAQAEQERAAADRQRTIAEHAQGIAAQQRALAEQRTKEAETERRKEQERYRDVRSLAASLLFDLHDGIRDLAGSTMARRLIVGKAQHQLELLSADSGNDLGLQRDLAASYERMGELRVDPQHPNENDARAALDAYEHAVRLRRSIVKRSGDFPGDQRDLALSLAKVGDGQFMASDPKQALESYQSAWTLAHGLVQSQPKDVSMRRALGTVDERRCVVFLTAGDNAGALEACQEGITVLSPLANTSPNDVEVERLIATTEASYANALRLSHKPGEATVQAQRSLAALDRLELLAPNNAEYRRLSSSAEAILAGSLAASGQAAASLEAFRRSVRSMEIAVEIDPSDLGSPLRLAVTLRAFSRGLNAAGNKDGAHQAAQEAIRLLEETAERPNAGAMEWNEYADALLKVDWPDLVQPAKALQLALKAVSATNRKNPFFLDTLAWAYFRTGDTPKAAETERQALSLLPADAKGGLHDELDRGLNTFLAGTRP